jgi:hypothetical protein
MLRRSSINAVSFRQSLADQPFLDEIGDLVAVPVHHDHVGITFEAHLGQVVDVHAAARGLEHIGVIDDAPGDLDQRGWVLTLSPYIMSTGRALDRGDLLLSPPSVGSTATSALTLSGRASKSGT